MDRAVEGSIEHLHPAQAHRGGMQWAACAFWKTVEANPNRGCTMGEGLADGRGAQRHAARSSQRPEQMI
jgi:hypothetical protein